MPHSRYYSGVANVRDFGAKGDGFTNDRDAIQHAVDFSSVVYFPPGTYVVEKRDTALPNGGSGETVGVVIPADTRIFGEPGQSIIITKLPDGVPGESNAGDAGLSHAVSWFWIDFDTSNVHVEGLTFRGDGPDGATASDYAQFQNLQMAAIDLAWDRFFDGAEHAGPERVTIRGCTFERQYGFMVHARAGGKYVVVEECFGVDCMNGMNINSDNSRVANCAFLRCEGFEMTASWSEYVNNRFTDCFLIAMAIGGNTGGTTLNPQSPADHTGTLTAAVRNATTGNQELTQSGAGRTANADQGKHLVIITGGGAPFSREIISNTADTWTTAAFPEGSEPAADDTFAVFGGSVEDYRDYGNLVLGNVIVGGDRGIDVTTNMFDTLVANNVVIGTRDPGLMTSTDYSDIRPRRISFTNNYVIDCGRGPTSEAAIHLETFSDVQVIGNVVRYGERPDHKQSYGLLARNGEDLLIDGNYLSGSFQDVLIQGIPDVHWGRNRVGRDILAAVGNGPVSTNCVPSRVHLGAEVLHFESVDPQSGTVAADWSEGNTLQISLNGNATLVFSSAAPGGYYQLLLSRTAAAYIVTWPGSVKWPGGGAPVLSGADKTDVFRFFFDGTSYWASVVGLDY